MKGTFAKAGLMLLALATIASCGTQKKFIHVENVKNVSTVKHNPIIYSLPKTAIQVKVTAINEVSVRGPYYQYAQKYIGTDDIINKNSSSWKLGSIQISSYPIKDTARTFVLDCNYPYTVNFSPEGFLESINTSPDYQSVNYREDINSSYNNSEDLSNSRKFQEMKNVNRYETVFDTVLHVVDADSIFTTVPTAKKNLVRKSLDEQAQELANQIFVLRDDRNALLVGESDGKSLPSGEALKYMIEQLNKLEESYMSMFIGKKIKQEKTYVFTYIPTSESHIQEILFKFSPEYGIQSKNSLKGNPIMVDVTDLGDNKTYEQFEEQQQTIRRKSKCKDEVNGLAYLSNASAKIKIIQNSNTLCEKVLNINQLGKLQYLPESLMSNDNFKLILYPNTGTIKSMN
ncbi:MAG: DUF4831 family protein [Bacteroidales bacterium]|nr:DUF4831 family protein [Bacteroidales bacterium]